jgi:putative membrane protein
MPDFYNVGWSIPLFPPATEESHTIWVAADTKNFQMPPLTLAVTFHFPETNQSDITATLAPYIAAFYNGMVQVNEGIGSAQTDPSLLFGVNAIYDGMQQLGAGLSEAPAAISTLLKPGVDEMAAGIAESLPLIGSSIEDPDTLLYAANAIVSYLQMIQGMLGAAGTEGSYIDDAYKVMMGLSNEDPGGLLQDLQGLSEDLGVVLDILLAAQGDLNGVYNELMDGSTPGTIRELIGNSPTMAALEKVNLGIVMNATAADVQAVIDSLPVALLQEMQAGVDADVGDVTQMHEDITAVYGGLAVISAIIGSTTTDPSLLYGAAAVEGGLIALRAALSTGDPADPGIYEGLLQVSGGLDELASGLSEAVAGIGSAGTPDTLLYGADQVNSGLTELKDGTLALEEGLGLVMTNFSMTGAELEAIAERGEEFDHFLGRAEDAESEVRFVYQTEPTYNYITGNSTSWIVAIILSVIIALGLVLGGILLARRYAA